jgi:hypothetical protein
MIQVVEHLPRKYKALSSNRRTAKKYVNALYQTGISVASNRNPFWLV